MFFSKIVATALSVFALGAMAAPTPLAASVSVPESLIARNSLEQRGLNCNNPPQGLTQKDCNHMQNINMAFTGINSYSNNGKIWIGNDGPNTFTFKNMAGGVPVTLVIWLKINDGSSFVAPGGQQPISRTRWTTTLIPSPSPWLMASPLGGLGCTTKSAT